VCDTLAKLVLTSPNQEVKVLATTQRESKGHNLFEVEFTAANSKYTRHSLAVVGVANGEWHLRRRLLLQGPVCSLLGRCMVMGCMW
jgi:hypothetical protein